VQCHYIRNSRRRMENMELIFRCIFLTFQRETTFMTPPWCVCVCVCAYFLLKYSDIWLKLTTIMRQVYADYFVARCNLYWRRARSKSQSNRKQSLIGLTLIYTKRTNVMQLGSMFICNCNIALHVSFRST